MKSIITFAIMWAVSLMTATAHANITYMVDRTIDQGTITGYIETDGTLGVLSTVNIIDWEITITAPNLLGGSPYVISHATQNRTFLTGSVTTATPTDILFDISGGSGVGHFFLHGGGFEPNYWCIETADAHCTGEGIGEHIGRDENTSGNAQSTLPTGTFSIATAIDPITYTVNRTIDQGTVTGYIETDGTLGVLSTANIIDWELTLTAPNLLGGSPYVINHATQTQTFLNGSVTTATSTDILFDNSGGSGDGIFMLHGGGSETNYWCVETVSAGCTGEAGEHIGRDENTSGNAQSTLPTGTFSIATVRTPITYIVNRTIDQGTVTGFVQTDGTLGTLASENIIDWELTLTAPNLLGGSPYVINHTIQTQAILNGSVTTATPTDIFFDISGGSGDGFFLLQGGAPVANLWCLETAAAACTGVAGEHIGLDDSGSLIAQSSLPTGTFSIATVQTPITYLVYRTIDQGTITGYIETDGTLGTLASGNIIDLELTLTAPNLFGGSPSVISQATLTQTSLTGSVTIATPTDILFDISGGSGEGYFSIQGGPDENFWCVETAFAFCTGTEGEHIGRDDAGNLTAQSSLPTGTFSIATVQTPITYIVNRTIDQGTITGYIETDGTIGTLASENIIDWEITLTAPNLLGGSPYVISHATQTQTGLTGSVTTATPTDILFDISGGSGDGYFFLHGGGIETNFWCVETVSAVCTGVEGEHIGRDEITNTIAQSSLPTGTFSIASVASMCPADLTGDGALNFFDVSAFLIAFSTMDPAADFTGDGLFNFFDVSAFLTAFAAGCP